jgi:hypothetical protein
MELPNVETLGDNDDATIPTADSNYEETEDAMALLPGWVKQLLPARTTFVSILREQEIELGSDQAWL